MMGTANIGVINTQRFEFKPIYDAEVEYLKSTGTQWIDTGFKAVGGCKVEFRCLQADPTADGLLVGSHNPSNNSSNYYNRNQAGIASQGALKFNKCDRFEDITVPAFDLYAFHTFAFDTRGNSRIGYFDGRLVLDGVTSSVLNPVNNVVMWISQYRAAYSSSPCVPGSISWLKIWDSSDTLVRNMIPVRFTNEQGVTEGAMYDRVSMQLFRNQGTGYFAYGNDKQGNQP